MLYPAELPARTDSRWNARTSGRIDLGFGAVRHRLEGRLSDLIGGGHSEVPGVANNRPGSEGSIQGLGTAKVGFRRLAIAHLVGCSLLSVPPHGLGSFYLSSNTVGGAALGDVSG
jgi:hypothetical protein